MTKKRRERFDQTERLYAALHGRHIALATIRPTALEAAEANRRFNPSADAGGCGQIIEVRLSYDLTPNFEMPV